MAKNSKTKPFKNSWILTKSQFTLLPHLFTNLIHPLRNNTQHWLQIFDFCERNTKETIQTYCLIAYNSIHSCTKFISFEITFNKIKLQNTFIKMDPEHSKRINKQLSKIKIERAPSKKFKNPIKPEIKQILWFLENSLNFRT